jgi:ribokinase
MAAKLGASVTMVTKLGKDVFGRSTYENYVRHGIDTRYIFWSEEFSGVAPIFVDDEGHNVIVIVPGANWALTAKDVREASNAIKEADVVICQLEVPLETSMEALKLAKEGSALTIFNPAPGRPLPENIFGLCDIIVPNRVETEAITGINIKTFEDSETAIKRLLGLGARTAIITLGEEGSMVGDEEGMTKVPSIHVRAIDSTGAGDAYIGTLAYCLAVKKPIRESVRIANVAAALSVTKIGTQLSFPSKEEVKEACRSDKGLGEI